MTIYKNLLQFLLILLGLSSAYAPAIYGYYAHHDDYFYWIMKPGWKHPQFDFIMSMGRFTGVFLQCWAGWLINSIADLSLLRVISMFNLCLCALGLSLWMRPLFPKPLHAYLLSIMIFTLPPFQAIVGWATCTYASFAVLLATLAGLLTAQIQPVKSAKLFSNPSAVFSVFCFLGAISIYQPAAMFYWTLPAILVCLGHPAYSKAQIKQQITHFLIIGITTLILYAFFLQFIKGHYLTTLGKDMYNPYAMSMDIKSKILWFINEPLINALNLWTIFPQVNYAICALVLILGTIICKIEMNYLNGKDSGDFLRSIVLILGFLVLGFLPNLINIGFASFYRCLPALATIVLIIFVWVIREWLLTAPSRWRPTVLSIFLFIGSLSGISQAHINIQLYRNLPSYLEIAYLKDILNPDLAPYKKIHIVRPAQDFRSRYFYPGVYDEFANLTAYGPQDMVMMLKAMFWELGKPEEFENFFPHITSSINNKSVDDSTLLVDLRKIHEIYKDIYEHTRFLKD